MGKNIGNVDAAEELSVNTSTKTAIYEIYWCGMDGLDHEEEFEGTRDELEKRIIELEEYGGYFVSIGESDEL